MIARRLFLGGLAALAGSRAAAQGFAGLASDAQGFAAVVRGRPLAFPADHGPHPDFRIEWWYVTANIKGPDGADYGVQWTLFRQALAPGDRGEGWDSAQFWMGHAAATSADAHRAAERFGRGGVGQAGVTLSPFEAWIDDWRLASPDDRFESFDMAAAGDGFSYALRLGAHGPRVAHGEDGYSQKSERGTASWYYALPFLTAEGTLTLDGRAIPVTGSAWLDREWSSQPMEADQTGWDWFALTLASGEKVMLYRFRQTGGDAFAGTWITPDGAARALSQNDVAMTPSGWESVAGRRTPVRWRLRVSSMGFDVQTRPLNAQAWNALLIPYWEGPVFLEGSHEGAGYLEMTGY